MIVTITYADYFDEEAIVECLETLWNNRGLDRVECAGVIAVRDHVAENKAREEEADEAHEREMATEQRFKEGWKSYQREAN